MDSQWLFPFSALSNTPSWEASGIPLETELRERAKGIEFLFRVAAQLGLWVNPLQGGCQLICLTRMPLAPMQSFVPRPSIFIVSICDSRWRIILVRYVAHGHDAVIA